MKSLSAWCRVPVLATTFFLACTTAHAQTRPNILFLLADDLGYGEVGFNGQKRYATPNIDRLAREGLVFTDHYAGSPVCAPSRNTLMTGHHSGHAAIRNNFSGRNGGRVPLPVTDRTIAERLKAAGYTTGIIGKWGLGEEDTPSAPWLRGWDFFYGFVNQDHASNHYPEFLYRNSGKEVLPENYSHRTSRYANDLFTAEAEKFLDRAAAAPRAPFFLFMAFTTPHADLAPPADAIETLKREQAWARDPAAKAPDVAFAAMVMRLDRDVGRLLARLQALGLERDTLVIFTGDNGAHDQDGKDNSFFNASGPFRGHKRDVTEGGIREPFAARWPGRIAPGTRTAHPAAFWDFSATVLELAGLPRPVDLPAESISYVPTLLGRQAEQKMHDFLYWEFVQKNHPHQAIRAGQWKGVRSDLTAALELYDLSADPGEKNNLAAAHADIVARLTQLLTSAHVDSPDYPLTPAASQGKVKAKPGK